MLSHVCWTSLLPLLLLQAPAQQPPDVAPPAIDARVPLSCTVSKRGRPEVLAPGQDVSAGVVHEERPRRDGKGLELRWRHLAVARWSGRASLPVGLDRCRALLAGDDGLVALCRHEVVYRAQRVIGRQLVRLRPGREAIWLAEALAFSGEVHLEPLGGGRLLAWAEGAALGSPLPRDPDQAAREGPAPAPDAGPRVAARLLAVEIYADGAIAQHAAIDTGYRPGWAAGPAFVVIKAATGAGAPAAAWRARWLENGHRLDWRPEPARGALPICRGVAAARDTAPASVQLPGLRVWAAVARLGEEPAGACLQEVELPYHPYDRSFAWLRAERGRLQGRAWVLDEVTRPRPGGGTLPVAKVTPVDVLCEVQPPR
jgi:hypothetical protein